MIKKTTMTCAVLFVVVLASGCNRQPTIPDAQMGDSVRRVMNSQINDYEAAIHPNPDAVEGSDPYRLEGVLNAHREDIANAQEVQKPVTISIGSE